jgi:sulfite exporter TauE/SafE
MNGLTLGAALLLGFAASGHCLVMCGGITAALGMAAAKDATGRTRLTLLIGYQLGRIGSYSLAGLLLGGIFGGLVRLLDIESIRQALRALSALALLLAALAAFGYWGNPDIGIGRRLWPRIAPLGRRLLPVNTLPRALAFGTVWGWMPCGFVYSVLLVAALQADAVHSAIIMAAFGIGTIPALLMAALGAQKFAGFAALAPTRYIAGSVLLLSAALTLAGPWMEHSMPALHAWLPFDCGVVH